MAHTRTDLNNAYGFTMKRFERSGIEDYSDDEFDVIAGECEEFCGDMTKMYNSARLSNYRPNRQASGTLSSLRVQKMKSGEAYIQQYMNEAGQVKTPKRQNDPSDRATVEQVLDPRTLKNLSKLLDSQVISEIHGCISTGKEANVYHAKTLDGNGVAIKIYKTSILTFKSRDKYITDERRNRTGYCRHNPRKMVEKWADKERSNLERMYSIGLPVPKPIMRKGKNILLMEFIGVDDLAAPLLKNAKIDEGLADLLYCQCINIMWKIYRECKLVHADLSEYNMLLFNNRLIIIDVSQSVEHDNPHSLEFLRRDIANITKFFLGKGASVLGLKRLFELIVDSSLTDSFETAISEERTKDPAVLDEPLFMSVFIPHKLDEIIHFERDAYREKLGLEINNPYQKMVGKTVETLPGNIGSDGSDSNSIADDDSCDSNAIVDDDKGGDTDGPYNTDFDDDVLKQEPTRAKVHFNRVRCRDESPTDKRARKTAVKEEQREKRTHKIPKKVKKRREKQNKK